ncbi:MAG TPA: zf-HC2 domain-containing protein [Ktedonobacterales bacterium]
MSDRDTRDCDSVAPYLSAFADGELAEPLRSEVAAHVADCAHCAAQLERVRALDQLLASLPHTAPSAGVYARTLAATRHTADSRSVSREALPGANGAALRRRLRAIIAPQTTTEDDIDVVGAAPPASTRRRSRAPWVAAAIPAAAALLLIALAATLFNRFPSFPQQGAVSHATPNPASSLQQTHSAISALASQLAFTPLSPTYLPTGASAPRAIIGPAEQVQANSRYLDVTWTFGAGPVQSLHLRELPSGLGFDGYTPASGGPAATLAWSLPQMAGWQPLNSITCPNCLAVGETHATLQLALDAQPRGAASVDQVSAWLRLVSLSLDAPYMPVGVSLAPPDSSLALRYQAMVNDAQGHSWQWNVSVLGANGSQQYARAKGNGVDVTEIINGGSVARFDNATQTYEVLAPPLPSAQPPHVVTQPLNAADEYITSGELWNLGPKQTRLPDGRSLYAYDFYWVNAAQPEHIYADANTGQTVALVVTTPTSAHPGGPDGVQTYVSTAACQPYTVTYTFIEYVAPAVLAPTLFDTTQPGGWSKGTVTPAFTCQG